MKNIIFSIVFISCAAVGFAQNKNVKDETKTTTRTITGQEGTKVLIKTEETKEVQNIELKDAKPNTLNIETKDSPIEVTSITKITNPDGTVRTIDADRSSFFESNGKKYKVALDETGYNFNLDGKKMGFLRKTSNNSYIFKANNKFSIAYFDTNGNLIMDTYDDKTDRVTTEIYTIMK